MQTNHNHKIQVCHGPRCRDYGGSDLAARLKELGMDAKTGECQSLCPHSPVVHVNEQFIPKASIDEIVERL